jgi:hypothetical protein
MTLLREAFVLPFIFLTVALLGGLRVSGEVRLIPPSLISLALAMLLLASLGRARVVVPELLMNSGRNALENLSGLVVLLSLFAGSAQIFNLVTPESGLFHAIFSVVFLVQLLTTLTAVRDRVAMLRSLVVLLGAAFLLRFVVLESLYSPEGGTLKRVLTTLMEGATLGTLEYVPHAPATGYVGFMTLMIYMVGLTLLGAPATMLSLRDHERPLPIVPPRESGAGIVVICVVAGVTACSGQAGRDTSAPASPGPATPTGGPADARRAAELREAALPAARVWRRPDTPIPSAPLGENPPSPQGWQPNDLVSCKFVIAPVGGTTPKFTCTLPHGETLKVKYGRGNAEVYAEVAATRLLSAIGFGADRMYLVATVRCAGCPPFPFQALKCFQETGIESVCFTRGLDYARHVDFHNAVIERPLEGRRIEAVVDQGWAWYELNKIDPSRGGSTRAEVDALRLMAMFLAHWDNKGENQRLVCLPGGDRLDGSCATPFAILQDLGATFGPNKLDLHNWGRTSIWADARECRLSMKTLPWGGGTFPDTQVSEEGRRLLLGLLEQISTAQLEALFTKSRVIAFDGLSAEARSATAWIKAFQDKVRQLREGGPCPGRLKAQGLGLRP